MPCLARQIVHQRPAYEGAKKDGVCQPNGNPVGV